MKKFLTNLACLTLIIILGSCSNDDNDVTSNKNDIITTSKFKTSVLPKNNSLINNEKSLNASSLREGRRQTGGLLATAIGIPMTIQYVDNLPEITKIALRSRDFHSFRILSIQQESCEDVETWLIERTMTGRPGPEEEAQTTDDHQVTGSLIVNAILNYEGNCSDFYTNI